MSSKKKIKILKSDITQLDVDAIVNAANESLLGGGGVDGAIHRAAGRELLYECETLNGCKTGDAKITKGYNLSAKHVIHTVGPIWRGGENNEAELLANCYKKSLELAANNSLKTIAFPNISTGIYGYPKSDAAEIALNEVLRFLNHNESLSKVIFAIFDDENFELYKKLYKNRV
ncbi:MAG: O-acetyl-ADP-ribose deacetylase [Salinivirgaceae bacterium]|nr:O-acetyl-ADP-ribose deacetylase [Salinivirgaceae bacterium]